MSLHTVERTTNPQPAAVQPAEPAKRRDSIVQGPAALTDGERMKVDGLVQPPSVAGMSSEYNPSLTNGDRIRADGL